MHKTAYTSGIDRLNQLPAFFSLNTLVRQSGWDRATAKMALSRWAAKRWVQAAGPRAGTYFNLIADKSAADLHLVTAILHAYPSAILGGESVLHSAGWITQIPSALTVFVEARRSYTAITGVVLRGRPVAWFSSLAHAGAIHRNGANNLNAYGLRFVAPAWSLADLYASDDGWQPDEDDLDIPEEETENVCKACKAMGNTPEWLDAACSS